MKRRNGIHFNQSTCQQTQGVQEFFAFAQQHVRSSDNSLSSIRPLSPSIFLYLLLPSSTFLPLKTHYLINQLVNLFTRQLVNLSTCLLKTHSLFLTNATLKIENSALRLMPFHAFSPAPRRHFFRVNKTKRCPKAAEKRFFQHYFCGFYSPYRHYSSYISY